MRYSEAYRKFSECYKDRYAIEFPAIFSLCNFKGKSVLDVGAGKEGHFPKKVKKSVKRYVATDVSRNILNELRKVVNVETKVCKAEKLPFADKSFDIAFSRWAAQHFDNLEKGIGEMCRIAKCCVIIILPSEQGDQTKLLAIKFKNKYKFRKERVVKIKKLLRKNGFKLKEKKKLLKFVFPDINEAFEIINAMEFRNKLNSAEKEKIRAFLLHREKKGKFYFTQGAAFICGYR